MPDSLDELQAHRTSLLKQLSRTGDMRQGSITEHFSCCGKETCRCHGHDHPGHGPYYAFTKSVDGKTKTLQMRQGPLLSKMQREVQTYRNFRAICTELVRLNEKICDLLPVREEPVNTHVSAIKKKSYKKSRRK